MSAIPANVAETTALIIKSGIAQRVVSQPIQDADYPQTTHGCLFWVSTTYDRLRRRKIIELAMKYPPHGYVVGFNVQRGQAFGVAGQAPLTVQQVALVERLAAEWEQNQKSAVS